MHHKIKTKIMVKKMIIHLECQVALSSGFSLRFFAFGYNNAIPSGLPCLIPAVNAP
jgi:hypothetical protein